MPLQCIKHYAGPRDERAGGKKDGEIRCGSYKHGIKLSGYINRLNTVFKRGCPKQLELPVTPSMWISLGLAVVLGITSIYWCKIMITMVQSLLWAPASNLVTDEMPWTPGFPQEGVSIRRRQSPAHLLTWRPKSLCLRTWEIPYTMSKEMRD